MLVQPCKYGVKAPFRGIFNQSNQNNQILVCLKTIFKGEGKTWLCWV